MTKMKGKDCDFAIGTATVADPEFNYGDGGMVRIETISNEVTLNIETTTVDASAYGDDFDQSEVITYRWTVDITCYFQPDAGPDTESIFVNGLLALAKYPFCLSIAGKPAGEDEAGKPKYSGRVIIANASPTPTRNGLTMMRIRLQGDGKLDRQEG